MTASPAFTRLRLLCALVLLAAVPALQSGPAAAYSYSAAGAEPLLDAREALYGAIGKGDWETAGWALGKMQADIDYLDQNEDKGLAKAFADAIATKNVDAVKAAFLRAATDEIARRINGAENELQDYQTAKVLVAKAQRFYTAIAADLDPETARTLEDGLRRALAAIGNPGVFGVGAKKTDPAGFDAARGDILKALGKAP